MFTMRAKTIGFLLLFGTILFGIAASLTHACHAPGEPDTLEGVLLLEDFFSHTVAWVKLESRST